MSFSVDDLVSSLSSTHVGQEAIDLALLQAQLAETLFSAGPSNNFVRGRSQNTQPCTTPTARTPSASSSSWGFMDATPAASERPPLSRTRANSVSSAYANDMDEDERMVEELLLPSSSTSSSTSYNYPSSSQMSMNTTNSFSDPYPSSPTSSFTTTDPFYVAQLQSLNAPPSPSQSVFSQSARLNPSSPFAIPSQYHHQLHHHLQQHGHGMSMNMNMNMNHNALPLKSYTTAAAAF